MSHVIGSAPTRGSPTAFGWFTQQVIDSKKVISSKLMTRIMIEVLLKISQIYGVFDMIFPAIFLPVNTPLTSNFIELDYYVEWS